MQKLYSTEGINNYVSKATALKKKKKKLQQQSKGSLHVKLFFISISFLLLVLQEGVWKEGLKCMLGLGSLSMDWGVMEKDVKTDRRRKLKRNCNSHHRQS